VETVNTNKLFSLISIIEPIKKDRLIITDWDLTHCSFPSVASNKSNCVSSLFLRFNDIDRDITTNDGSSIKTINKNQIKLLASFIRTLEDNPTEEVYVNCAAGISRSAAVAAAISKYYKGEDQYFFDTYVPNMFVYSSIINELASN
jgi:predicted protein tyrosine phosphatase